jgi:hypothetical protein
LRPGLLDGGILFNRNRIRCGIQRSGSFFRGQFHEVAGDDCNL